MTTHALLLGSTGQLGRALLDTTLPFDIVTASGGRSSLDVTDAAALRARLDAVEPSAVVNVTGYTDVDAAESAEAEANAVNAEAVGTIATWCAERGALLVHISTDYVFDGRADRPYRPDDPTGPVSVYGRSKLEGERRVRKSGCVFLIVRTSWLFGAGERNFVRSILHAASSRDAIDVVDDQTGSPAYAPDVAEWMAQLIRADARGTFHVANAGACSRHAFAVEIVRQAGLSCDVRPCATSAAPRPAARPAYSVLELAETTAVTGPPPSWADGLGRALATISSTRTQSIEER